MKERADVVKRERGGGEEEKKKRGCGLKDEIEEREQETNSMDQWIRKERSA